MWKSFLGAVRFILTKYDPVSSHGDPVHANFGRILVANLTFGMQVLSLDYIYIYIYIPGCKSCTSLVRLGTSLVRLGTSLVRLGTSLVRLGTSLVLDASLVVGCKSCRRVKVGHARNTPLEGVYREGQGCSSTAYTINLEDLVVHPVSPLSPVSPRIPAIRCHQPQVGTPLPHARGARMT